MTAHLYRCTHCGNKTRFDVYDTVRRRRYEHASLAGEVSVDDEQIVARTVDRVVCRWCERDDAIEDLGPPG
jgi:ABC-type cobalamin/Fe3+-siderophores transport system ATPase subunit